MSLAALLLSCTHLPCRAASAVEPKVEEGVSRILRVWAEGFPTSVCWLATPAFDGVPAPTPSYPYCDNHCGVYVQDADPFTPGYQPPGDIADLIPLGETCPFEAFFDVPGEWDIGVTIQYVHESEAGDLPYETSATWRISVDPANLLFKDDFESGDEWGWSATTG